MHVDTRVASLVHEHLIPEAHAPDAIQESLAEKARVLFDDLLHARKHARARSQALDKRLLAHGSIITYVHIDERHEPRELPGHIIFATPSAKAGRVSVQDQQPFNDDILVTLLNKPLPRVKQLGCLVKPLLHLSGGRAKLFRLDHQALKP
jgi:hypothetical protein